MAAKSDGMAVSNATVVFKHMEGDVGVFDVGFTLSKDEGPMSMKVDMKGPVKVAKSMMSAGFARDARVSVSHRTMRPSASVLTISMVVPSMAVTTSLGL